jgi:hypothetical protein
MAMLELLRGMRPGLTVHGFRSTFRDWAAERTSFASEVVEMALAHVIDNKTEAAYRRGDLFDKRRQNRELETQIATFGMAAGEAARYRSELEKIRLFGDEGGIRDPFGRLGEYDSQAERNPRLAQERAEQERSRRAGEQQRRILGGGEGQARQLELQAEAFGKTAGEAARLREEQRLLQQLQQAGIPVTDELRDHIAGLAERVGEATQHIKDLQRQMQQIEAYGNVFSSSLERAFSDWLRGADTNWRQFFNRLATDIATLTLRMMILQPLFGGGGISGGLFGQFVSSLIPGLPGRAAGGSVSAGQMYMVGEHGPEPFIPAVDGLILPHGGMGGGATINMRVDLAGANGEEAIARISAQAARAAALQAVDATNQMFPARQRRLQMLES